MTPPLALSAASDQDLVASARRGHLDAYNQLVRRHRRSVYGLILRLVHDHDLAEDMTQDVFVKAFRELESHRPEDSFSSWILKIANNQALNHLKREQRLRRRGLDTVPLEPTPDASSPRKLMAGGLRPVGWSTPTPTPRDTRALAPALDEALARLKETYRQCFILREIEGRSYEDIAEILDLPVGTVGPCLTRARSELRAALGPLYQALRASSLTPA
jgi:RNA polymerase sigma-70 factor (ECF subfamily)